MSKVVPTMSELYIAQLKAKRTPFLPFKASGGTPLASSDYKLVAVPLKRKTIKHDEAALQTSIVLWFGMQYPEFSGMLFAVPNGGRRDAREGARLKKEGVRAGVADLILLVPRPNVLLLEVKVKGGKLSDAQKTWLAAAASLGHTTAVAYDFHAARAAIVNHIGY